MDVKEQKIGVVCCSGEECTGGTISRLATRKMMDDLRPDNTVTICVPLFLAGGQEERPFAQRFPTIAVDGCDKVCAKKAIEKYSGKVSGAVLVPDLIGKDIAEGPVLSTRDLTHEQQVMVDKVAAAITRQFDAILDANRQAQSEKANTSCGCGCGGHAESGDTNKAGMATFLFKQGLSCSQAILAAYGSKLGLIPELAIKMASPFGGGIGRRGETCGAVTGALMVLGLLHDIKDSGANARSISLAREFMDRFQSRNGSVICRDLLQCDLNTPEGLAKNREQRLSAKLCSKFVQDAGEIVEEMIEENIVSETKGQEQDKNVSSSCSCGCNC